MTPDFSWVKTFNGVSQWLKDKQGEQKYLIRLLRDVGMDSGLTEKLLDGSQEDLTEIDPFTFFSMFIRNGTTEKRNELIGKLISQANIEGINVPTGYSGVPSVQPLKVWLFSGKDKRLQNDVPSLWRLFLEGANNTITKDTFDSALAVKNSGFTRLTQGLFTCFPSNYFPIDAQTKIWLKTNGIHIPENFEEYINIIKDIKSKFSEPLCTLSFDAWEANQFPSFEAIDYLDRRLKRVPGPSGAGGTSHIIGFETSGGKQLAIGPELMQPKIWLEQRPKDFEDSKVKAYEEDKSRNHHLKQYAPKLSAGNKAYLVTVGSLDELKKLCDWYEGSEMLENQKNLQSNNVGVVKPPLNQILYGPPGTGKTYNTINKALEIMGEQLSGLKRGEIKDLFDLKVSEGLIVFTTFHQSMSYEDFIEGIKPEKPQTSGGPVTYDVIDGIFRKICTLAESNKAQKYVLIIDEINRGNVSAIFGELITLIEEDKRLGMGESLKVTLPYSKKIFGVPSNLHILGTMNTADRSVEALDAALRRRFSFEEMRPRADLIKTDGKLKDSQGICDGVDMVFLLDTMNKRIERLIDSDHQIGHSFFMNVSNLAELKHEFKNKIIPLLQEYFFGDIGKIGLVLGSGFLESAQEESIPFAKHEYDSSGFEGRIIYSIKNIDSLSLDAFKIILEDMLPKAALEQ